MKNLNASLSILFISLFLSSCEVKNASPDDQSSSPSTPISQTPNVTPDPNSPPVGTVEIKNDVVNFSLTSDANKKVNLADYRDNVVVLFFFGNGCSSCKAASPSIEKSFVKNYLGKKVQVIGLDTWDGNLASVESFKNTSSLSFPLLLEASSVAKTLETTYDRLMIIDKKGVVRFKGNQLARNDLSNAVKIVDEFLAK